MEFLALKLAAKLKSVPAWLWVLLLAVSILFLAQCGVHRQVEAAKDEGISQGVQQEQAAQAAIILDHVEQASEARAEIRDPLSAQRYHTCLLSARSPQNCERFLPAGSNDLGGSRP